MQTDGCAGTLGGGTEGEQEAMAGRDPAQDKLAASYAEVMAKQIAEIKGEGKTPVPEDKKN